MILLPLDVLFHTGNQTHTFRKNFDDIFFLHTPWHRKMTNAQRSIQEDWKWKNQMALVSLSVSDILLTKVFVMTFVITVGYIQNCSEWLIQRRIYVFSVVAIVMLGNKKNISYLNRHEQIHECHKKVKYAATKWEKLYIRTIIAHPERTNTIWFQCLTSLISWILRAIN